MKLWKYSGHFLTATGVLHCAFALIKNWNVYQEIVSNGMVSTIAGNPKMALAFWFLVVGLMVIMLGCTLQHYINKEQKAAPQTLGWSLMALSIVGCAVVPVSGFWLFIPQAIIILCAKTRSE